MKKVHGLPELQHYLHSSERPDSVIWSWFLELWVETTKN
jgi:hypothetical protein